MGLDLEWNFGVWNVGNATGHASLTPIMYWLFYGLDLEVKEMTLILLFMFLFLLLVSVCCLDSCLMICISQNAGERLKVCSCLQIVCFSFRLYCFLFFSDHFNHDLFLEHVLNC